MYTLIMDSEAINYEWDEAKAVGNEALHKVSFDAVAGFDWDTADILEDSRKDYGEERFIAYGLIEDRLHCLVFTIRTPRVRVISLRRANKREVRDYGQE